MAAYVVDVGLIHDNNQSLDESLEAILSHL